MSYMTNTFTRVLDKTTGEKLHAENATFEAVHKVLKENFGVDQKEEDSIYIEFHHAIGYEDTEVFKALSEEHPDVVIEVNGEGEGQGDLWSARFADGKIETVRAQVNYPPFETITLPGEPRKKSIEERLNDCIETLNGIKDSGYWPFASPAPCSTEKKIKDGIYEALKGLNRALFYHQQMFCRSGQERDCMEAPRTVIKEVK